MIAGYVVTRKPIYDFDGGTDGRDSVGLVNGAYYHGLDRLNWFDVDNRAAKGRIPNKLAGKYRELEAVAPVAGVKVVKTLPEAGEFLSLDDDMQLMNEIIVITSGMLDNKQNGLAPVEGQVHWLGYDVVHPDGWSLIRHAFYQNRLLALFRKSKLNAFGLFDSAGSVTDFLQEYTVLAKNNQLNPIAAGAVKGIECIRIGSMG